MNNPNISPEKLNELLNMASQKLNTNPQRLRQAAQNGELEKLFSSLSPQQQKRLTRLMNDRQAAEQALNSPQAQQLLRNLTQDKKG
ncbi:hypothetical protein [Solibaculum mannosilyticum]|uniref:Uncharacterized protein n=1 Tax=Solibaculum mannosilyticum TaxID=2780922 RepID=A0A7I8D9Y1_9FIRM|nr:hypothetical protein [Solibaculum mannosilyticum]MCO7137434.1 alpha/beta hydrolase [[Clostridium] leptum]BCI61404.1 hypothetical protein C12CBH8_20430 [Solibaculum mannosilyticum]CZT55829.1 hypothetical protein BN3661_00915 [Eubacteriaceae bacterium CHKCI005]